jgi:hypothetical protein
MNSIVDIRSLFSINTNDYISNLPNEILANILKYLSITTINRLMRTNKTNYNKIYDILQTAKCYNLKSNIKCNVKITKNDIINNNINNDDINNNSLIVNNTKKIFSTYIYLDIYTPNEDIPIIEKIFNEDEYNNLSLFIYKNSNFNYKTKLFKNITDITFYNIDFDLSYQLNIDNVEYLEFSKCNVNNNLIKNIKNIGTLIIDECNTLREYDNNISCNIIIFIYCENLIEFGNINCNIIELNSCKIIKYNSLNNKNIQKLQIVNAEMLKLEKINIPNISIINSKIDYIYNIYNITRLKILDSIILKIFNIDNCKILIIDNCSYDFNTSLINISNIKNVDRLSVNYIISDECELKFIPKISFDKLKNIKNILLEKVKLIRLNIDNCKMLSVNIFKNEELNNFINTSSRKMNSEEIEKLYGFELNKVNNKSIKYLKTIKY